MNGGMEAVVAEEGVNFLPLDSSLARKSPLKGSSSEHLLTREDLLTLDKKEPKWRYMRIGLLVLFWVIWFGLLAASITVIIVSPKCPPVPQLNFWQAKVGYWVDPFAFCDSDGDKFGDFKGLMKKIDYIKNTVGAGFLILDGFVKGQYQANKERLGLTTDFKEVDEKLGTQKDFRSLLRAYHKKGLDVVVSLDFNSVSLSHGLASKNSKAIPSLVTRSGERQSSESYSTFGFETVDLDLSRQDVRDELKIIVKHWLEDGVDGILLSNAAFYMENLSTGDTVQDWQSSAKKFQVFMPGSVEVVREIFEVVKQISSHTGKPRLLLVDAGDTGFGISIDDNAVMFLGTEENASAHLVVSRLLVRDRGEKFSNQSHLAGSVELYRSLYQGMESKVALATATPSDRYHGDFVALASIFLLPGTPLLYYGSELGQNVDGIETFTDDVYPKTKKPLVSLNSRDSQLACHLPMPWDQSGVQFSPAFNEALPPDYFKRLPETVERALTPGRGATPLKLTQSLIRLRKKPSLLWGKFEKLDSVPSNPAATVEAFIREAEGYPSFVCVLIRNATEFQDVIRLPDKCKRFVPRILYPSSSNLKLDEVIEGNRVFLEVSSGSAVYVFECHHT